MFESNSDFEFDKIFDDDLQPYNTTTKRAIENEVCVSETNNKKLCLGTNNFVASPTTSFQKDKIPQPEIKFGFHRKTEVQVAAKSPNKKVVLRKFPGPAGLLPERRDFNIDIKALEVVGNKPKQDNAMDMDICSQMSVRAFHEGPWDKMIEDFRSTNNLKLFLPDKYNIAWIKDKVRNNKLINQKAPFLAAIIQNIECSKSKTAVVSILLKDTTGQLHGTIIYDLYEENINELKVGSVVVLKQFGVLTTDRGCNLYITITTNNLVAIYSNETDDIESTSEVKVTAIQKISVNDFIKNINDIKIRHRNAEKLKSVFGFNDDNLNLKLSIQKHEVQHVYNRFSTPIKSKSSEHINVNLKNQNAHHTGSSKNILSCPKVGSPLSRSNVNKTNDNSSIKFNFKSVKFNNKVTDTLISDNKNVLNNTQISIVPSDNTENNVILQNILDGVDADLLFGDF